MPKAVSKAQQRMFYLLASKGKMSMAEAKARSVKGKAFKRLPDYRKKEKK